MDSETYKILNKKRQSLIKSDFWKKCHEKTGFFLFLFIYIFCSICPAYSQERNNLYVELTPRYGRLIKSPRSKGILTHTQVSELTAVIGFQTTGERYWEQFFNYPKYGLRLGFTNYLDPIFGKGIRLNAFLQAPFIRTSRFSFDYSFGVGLGGFTKYYDEVSNLNNDYVSTPISANLELMLLLEYQVSLQMDITAGFSFSHFSNGSTSLPNLGVNDMFGFGGLRYHFNQGNRPSFSKDLERPDHLKNEIYTFIAPSFMKYRIDGVIQDFFGATYEIGYRRQFHPCMRWGAGIDFMYNGYEMYSINEGKRSYWNNLSQGFFGSFELLFGDVSLHVAAGVCTFYSAKPRGVIYERAGVYYYFGKNQNQFAGVSIKANYGVAEYIEWTYGVKLKQF